MTRSASPARSRIAALGVALTAGLVLSLAGCGGEPSPVLPKQALFPVKGSVVTADGKPLTEGKVDLIPMKPDSRGATGKVQPDGTFTLTCAGEDGCPEGEFKVAINSDLTVPGTKPLKTVVPFEYNDEDSSGLKVTIKPGTNDLPPFKLVPLKGRANGPGGRAVRD
jgi:hypothetical protein